MTTKSSNSEHSSSNPNAMHRRKFTLLAATIVFSAATLAASAGIIPASAAGQGHKVLIVLSSEQKVSLRDNKIYQAGYYLDELSIPLRKIVEAGYTPVFANPKGNATSFDPASDDKIFFGGSDATRADAVKFLEGFPDLKNPKTFAQVLKDGTADYAGVFVPGGWSPMQDLTINKDLGKILTSFHENGRPTAVLCHGPAALLSTIPDAEAFETHMSSGDFDSANKAAVGWPYAGYHMTGFSRSEETFVEGQNGQLGGSVRYYLADALAQAGAHYDRLALWNVNVIEDRELVSGQQPFSSEALGVAFVAKLKATETK